MVNIYMEIYIYKGKEYNDSQLIFEGEYLFNKKWNGKKYDKNGNIASVFNNGNGIGKEYDFDDQLIFEVNL